MATCRDIVSRALVMAKIIPRGEDPEADELSDGMTVLQSLYDTWLTGGMFGRLTDVYEPGDYEAGEGERVFIDSGTLTLPTAIDDERKPRDLVAIEAFDDDGRKAYIWDRTEWVRIDSLTADDDAPLASRGVNGLAACVAMNYAEEFGVELAVTTVRQAGTFKAALAYRFGSENEPVAGAYF